MSLRARQGIELQYPEFKALEELPVQGMWTELPASKLPSGASPDMQNCIVLNGLLRKRFGYVQFPPAHAALNGPVVGLFSTQDEENNTHLLAVTPTSVYKYDQGGNVWTLLTGPALTGVATQPFSFENSQNSIVFSQGVDQVMLHVFSTSTYAVLDADCPPARYMTRFANRLVIAYTSETGDTKPFRLRRSVALDHTDWTGIGSGFTDLSEFPHHIRQIRKIGASLTIYTEESIQVATRTEIAAAPYRIDIVDTGAGLFADRAIGNIPGDRQIYLGNGNVYIFSGAQSMEVASTIREYLFNELQPDSIRHYFAAVLHDVQEVQFFVSASSETVYPNRIWHFNFQLNIWYPASLGTSAQPHCATMHRLDDSVSFDELVGTFDEQSWEFDSRFLSASYKALLTGHENGKVYQWSPITPSDDGEEIEARWTSRDFTHRDLGLPEPASITLRSLYIEGIDVGACDLDVSFSKDRGTTWEGPYAVSFTNGTEGSGVLKVVTHAISGHRIRFKIEHTSATQSFQLIAFYPVFERNATVTS
jgi:hypothetical protein